MVTIELQELGYMRITGLCAEDFIIDENDPDRVVGFNIDNQVLLQAAEVVAGSVGSFPQKYGPMFEQFLRLIDKKLIATVTPDPVYADLYYAEKKEFKKRWFGVE